MNVLTVRAKLDGGGVSASSVTVVRVALVTNIPAPYRMPVYRLVANEPGIEFKVFFCAGKEPDREWNVDTSGFAHQFMRERFITVRGRYIHVNPDIWQTLNEFRPNVVITTGFNPTHLLAYAWARKNRAAHIPMTDGTLAFEEMRLTGLHKAVRRKIFSGSKAYLGASDGSLNIYRSYGCASQRLFKSALCVNNELFRAASNRPKQFDLLFSGRFAEVKNPLFAIEVAVAAAKRLGRTISILFLGSGPLREAMQEKVAASGPHVSAVFAGFVSQEDLPAHVASARLLLFPTAFDAWGVVANEACAAGLPVLVTPYAGVAGELVRDGVNGFVLPLDTDQWVSAAASLLSNPQTYAAMSEQSLAAVENYSYAHSAKGVIDAVHRATRKKVVIVQRRLTHYRVPLFERLRSMLDERGVDLNVVFGDATSEEKTKDDEGRLPWGHYAACRYFLSGNLCWQTIGPITKRADLVVITQENKLLNNYELMLHRHFKLAFWGHGANLQSDQPQGLRERFKRGMASSVDWWFAYTSLSADLVRSNGFPVQRTTVLNNAIDVSELRAQLESVGAQEARAMRERLALTEGPVGIFLGSLHTDKRLDFLLDAAQAIRAQVPDFQLLIVGDGPLGAQVQAISVVQPWIRWAGAMVGRDKAVCLSLSTIMLNPGIVGLSVLDAFAAQLPILTTQLGKHSPEIAYLKHGVNGLMLENDLGSYVQACVDLLRNPNQREALRAGCAASAQEYTLEHMAERFCAGIVECLGTPAYRPGIAA